MENILEVTGLNKNYPNFPCMMFHLHCRMDALPDSLEKTVREKQPHSNLF